MRRFGPPIPGAPWSGLAGPVGPSGTPRPSPAVVTGTPGQGKQRPFIRRTPRVGKIDERRIAATAEQTSDYANSLIRQGILVQDGPGEWHLDPAGSGDGLTGTFPED